MSSIGRLAVGISGASGTVYGVRLLEVLRDAGIETHLILTTAAEEVARRELDQTPDQIRALGTYVYADDDMAAPLASGSFPVDGMVIVPCSIKSLSAVANSYCDSLLVRAADVNLKEGRPLILVVRETPLHLGHLRLMERAAEQGAVILPPMPAFYHRPTSIQDLVDQTVGKILDRLGVPHDLYRRWRG